MRSSATHAVLVSICVLLIGVCSGNLYAHDPDVEALRKLNRQIMEDLILRQDASTLLAHAHPDYRVVAPGGRVETKEMVVEGAASVVATGLAISDEQVIVVDDTGVVIGKAMIDGEMQPVGKLPPMKFMAVFARQDGQWKAVSRALTPCMQVALERGVC